MNIGDRMKQYESISDLKLTSRLPIIIRLDGRAFHTVTRKMPKPSYNLLDAMSNAMKATAEDMETCFFGYTQSDEVTFILRNDQSFKSTPWFMNRVQKICSVVASDFTYNFVKEAYRLPISRKTTFDARCFVVPNIEEAINCLIWRQRDCNKNSVSMVVYEKLREKLGKKGAKQILNKKNIKDRLNILLNDMGIDFYKMYDLSFINGIGTYKIPKEYKRKAKTDKEEETYIRTEWVIDKKLPIFSSDDGREFLHSILDIQVIR